MEARRLGPGDAGLAFEAVRTIKAPEPRPTFTAAYLERFLARPENVLIVASDGGEPTGFLLAYLLDRVDRDQPMACLYEIEVAGPHRRRGIGRAMVEVLKGVCREAGAMEAWVVTSRSNEAAARLYAGTGAVADTGGDEVCFVYGPESWEDG